MQANIALSGEHMGPLSLNSNVHFIVQHSPENTQGRKGKLVHLAVPSLSPILAVIS